jgi:hypothetical protein
MRKRCAAIHTNDLRGKPRLMSRRISGISAISTKLIFRTPFVSGMNDTVHALKQKAWEETIGKTAVPQIENPNYSPDPYYHGAYELLTAVCTEPWEESREARGKTRKPKARVRSRFRNKTVYAGKPSRTRMILRKL